MDAFDQLVMPEEGSRLQVYDDATGKPITPGSICKGHPTIGRGRALDTHGISQTEEEMLYQNDKTGVYAGLQSKLPWWDGLDPPRQAVVASLAFQMGLGGLLTFHDMLTYLSTKNFDYAASSLLASQLAKQTPARANLLANVLKTGQVPVAP